MEIKNILIAYSGSESSEAALDFALFIREKYDAHLTGLLVHNFAALDQYLRSLLPDDIRMSVKKAQAQTIKDIESQFKQSIASSTAPPERVHWISKSGEGDATVAQYARLFDLTIVGRYDAVHGEDHEELHPDMIAMVSGRPVLLVPREFDKSTFNEHAVLAWDGKRASARALADAMQILKTKSLVTIVSIDEGKSEISLSGIDVETYLQRHGVKTEKVDLKTNGRSIGYRILEYIEQAQPKLLVMGAYEHSKFRQSIVGGVTSRVLKKAKIPVLISH